MKIKPKNQTKKSLISHPHIGSSFESFLEEDGILEEVNAAAVKRVIARNLIMHMEKYNITQTKMAAMLKTSRAALTRLLDSNNYSVTLLTLNRAATIIGKKFNISLVNDPAHKAQVAANSKKK